MQPHATVSMQERFAVWVVAAVAGVSVLSSVVLLFNPIEPALHSQCAPQGAAAEATYVAVATRVQGDAP